MATPIAHALVGTACLSLVCLARPRGALRPTPGLMLWAAVAACLPDLDIVASLLLAGDPVSLHSGPTHSLFFAVAAGVAVWLAAFRSAHRAALAAMTSLAVASHVVVDLLTGPQPGVHASFGVPALWPFPAERLQAPVTLFRGVQHGSVAKWFSPPNLATVLIELVVWVPIAALLWRAAHRATRARHHAPGDHAPSGLASRSSTVRSRLRRLAPYAVPLILLVVVFLLFQRMQAHRLATDSSYAADHGAPLPVNVYAVDQGELDLRMPAECVAQANPMVRLSSPLPGRTVRRTAVKVGERVGAGSVLVTLDDTSESLAVARARDRATELERVVEAERERTEYFRRIRSQGMGLERDYKLANADLARARLDLAAAQADLRSSEGEQAKARVAAPVAGVVMGVAQPGESGLGSIAGLSDARNADDLAAIAVVHPILVECDVPEEKLVFLRPGQRIDASFPSLPGHAFDGRLIRIDPGAKAEARTVGIAVELPNPKGLLLPGVHGLIQVRETWQGLRIPAVALLNPRIDVAQVFVVDAGRARLRRITVGGAAGGFVQVLGGLAEGDRVVVAGQVGLMEDAAVRVARVVAGAGDTIAGVAVAGAAR